MESSFLTSYKERKTGHTFLIYRYFVIFMCSVGAQARRTAGRVVVAPPYGIIAHILRAYYTSIAQLLRIYYTLITHVLRIFFTPTHDPETAGMSFIHSAFSGKSGIDNAEKQYLGGAGRE